MGHQAINKQLPFSGNLCEWRVLHIISHAHAPITSRNKQGQGVLIRTFGDITDIEGDTDIRKRMAID